ncbi:MAG: hypothetical protein ACYDCI_07085 [Candidatus Limnocylindrales bacterium]
MAGDTAIVYLDVDDEITSAAARIRGADSPRIALVLPAGSRLATSRINFRLLAREAQTRSRQLVIVAPEAATRALAASAGIGAYASVRDLDDPDAGVQPAPAAETLAIVHGELVETASSGVSNLPVVGGSRRSGGSGGAGGGGGAGVGGGPGRLIVGGIVAVVVLVVAIAGFLLLPAATIVVTPRVDALGPLTFTVRADPTATSPDPSAGVVPATVPTFPLSATGTFPASGKKVTDTPATGSVTFSNIDPFSQHTIAAGSLVSTASGTAFATATVVILNPAQLVSSGGNIVIVPTTGSTAVTAAVGGTAGNVAAGAIAIPPTNQNPRKIQVRNPAPTSGGTHTVTLVVAQADINAATTALTAQLAAQLDATIADPAQVLPGTSVFPETKAMTPPIPSVDPTTLVGQQVTSFSYGLTATGSVTAVDLSAVEALAAARLGSSVAADHTLVAGSAQVVVGKGQLQGGAIVFPVRATAEEVRTVVAADLLGLVKGRTVADAQAALAPYGSATINLWPGFTDHIPDFDFRIDLSVVPGPTSATPSAPAGSLAPSSSPSGVAPGSSPSRSAAP